MKKSILFISCCFLMLLGVFCSKVMAQNVSHDYQFMLKNGKTWTCSRLSDYDFQRFTYSYKLEHETIVQGISYMILWLNDIEFYGDDGWHIYAYVRESDGKVFILYEGKEEESLLYDFQMQQNGKLIMPNDIQMRFNGCFDTNYNGKILTVQTFSISYIVDKPDVGVPDMGLECLESVGYSMDPFCTDRWFTRSPRLESCQENEECIFKGKDFGTLIPLGVSMPNALMKDSGNIYFDLQGRRINSIPAKGIYIRDGRKVVVE